MHASNTPLVTLIPVPVPGPGPVLDNIQSLDGGGTPRLAYIFSSGGAVVNVAVVQREKGKIILGILMVVVVGSGNFEGFF